MKKVILYLLLLVASIGFAQNPTGTTSNGKFKMYTPNQGGAADSVVVWNGATKELRWVLRSEVTPEQFWADDGSGNIFNTNTGNIAINADSEATISVNGGGSYTTFSEDLMRYNGGGGRYYYLGVDFGMPKMYFQVAAHTYLGLNADDFSIFRDENSGLNVTGDHARLSFSATRGVSVDAGGTTVEGGSLNIASAPAVETAADVLGRDSSGNVVVVGSAADVGSKWEDDTGFDAITPKDDKSVVVRNGANPTKYAWHNDQGIEAYSGTGGAASLAVDSDGLGWDVAVGGLTPRGLMGLQYFENKQPNDFAQMEDVSNSNFWVDASADYLEPSEDSKSVLVNSSLGFVSIESGGFISLSKASGGTMEIRPSNTAGTITLTGPSTTGTIPVSVEGATADSTGAIDLTSISLSGTLTLPNTTAFTITGGSAANLLLGNGTQAAGGSVVRGQVIAADPTGGSVATPTAASSVQQAIWQLVNRIQFTANASKSLVPLTPAAVTGTTYSMPATNYFAYITFTGGSGSTWTLPTVANATGVTYVISNQGTATITVNTNAGANDIYTGGASVNTVSVLAGQSMTFRGMVAKIVAE